VWQLVQPWCANTYFVASSGPIRAISASESDEWDQKTANTTAAMQPAASAAIIALALTGNAFSRF
jgi:hypothetical protein